MLSPVAYMLYMTYNSREFMYQELLEPEKLPIFELTPLLERSKQDLEAMLDCVPDSVIMLVGPESSGQTAMLTAALKNRPGVVYCNMRENPISSSSDLIENLLHRIKARHFTLRSAFMDVSPIQGGEIIVVKDGFTIRDLRRCLDELIDVLEMHQQRTGKPAVIALDNANALFRLTEMEGGQELVHQLCTFALYISRERKLAHFIFKFNDNGGVSVLRAGPDSGFSMLHDHVRHMSVRDMHTHEAEEWLRQRLPNKGTKHPWSDADIEKVVRVVGGRYGHLVRVLADAEAGKEVGSILFDFTIPMMERAVLALTPATTIASVSKSINTDEEEDDDDDTPLEQGWTFDQLWTALQLLQESGDRHTDGEWRVSYSKMLQDGFDGDEGALKALLEADLLAFKHIAFRNVDDIGRDEHAETVDLNFEKYFKTDRGFSYITADSPAMQHVLKTLLQSPSFRAQIGQNLAAKSAEQEAKALKENTERIKNQLQLLRENRQAIAGAISLLERVAEHRQDVTAHAELVRHLTSRLDAGLEQEIGLIDELSETCMA